MFEIVTNAQKGLTRTAATGKQTGGSILWHSTLAVILIEKPTAKMDGQIADFKGIITLLKGKSVKLKAVATKGGQRGQDGCLAIAIRAASLSACM